MFNLPPSFVAIRRFALVFSLVCSFSTVALSRSVKGPAATSIDVTTSEDTTFVTIAGTSPMSYSVSKPDTRTIVINLPGVNASRLAQIYSIDTPLVKGVTVERGLARGQSMPNIRVSLRANVLDRSQMAGNNLVLVLAPANKSAAESAKTSRVELAGLEIPPGAVNEAVARESRVDDVAAAQQPSPTPVRRPTAGITPSMDNRTSQSDQGQQYGQAGFVGEPINLNVVNADIRDILNYITEQYGVNFVIDSSVGAVPVTVNVQEVPWNVALNAILRANRLGVEVNGNILRVAANDVIAKEAETQKVINDSRLDNAALVTEFLRLNYARASGTLAQAAGSTGAFSGGATNLSFSGGAGGDATGGSGDQGLLPIISRRLSRRGSIEVDGRSNTLIITDVKENIEAIRQLVGILDQPEPQVEIETRIVIAQHNFSKDLGAQLALTVGSRRGGQASFSTIPQPPASTKPAETVGFVPPNQDAFHDANTGRFMGPFQPSGALGAVANTVIGLTTGLIGTAEISALISAAESRGEAKTVATPRVTALNNRPAQIESGSQIPVQTTQAAGGTAVVTTTFVSVPLRLSITPQITDAGTVILRVTIENNTINTGIAVGGVPGIDTQRMQSEVLVPDGGTTVMGGVLADTEGTTRQRTPGLASLPVVGNLFKRKLVTKSSSEILFFITPRIYRPDYQGRPTTGTPLNGPRSTTISQPVPLGNPSSNTPTPTQLQQQQQQQPNQTAPQQLNPAPGVPGATGPTARPGALGGTRP
ncbi:MAG: type pilus assembly protein PilQ [Blastocatellia bacterium]|jgi:type IV pilus assembly protein PilQ|nr:type pilus assembly protein PilQ [Blastocatellia bacterium]